MYSISRRLAVPFAGLVIVLAGCKLPPSGGRREPQAESPQSTGRSSDATKSEKVSVIPAILRSARARSEAPAPVAAPRQTRTASTPINKAQAAVREATAAGENNFYTSDPLKLRKQVSGYLAAARKAKFPARVMAIIAPHAGYDYSGPAAGWAYRQLMGEDIETVILIGGHAAKLTVGSVWPGGSWKTPLGSVAVDADLARALVRPVDGKEAPLTLDTRAHLAPVMNGRPDHALETQVPFIQAALPNAKIVPVYFNTSDTELAVRVGAALARAMKGRKVAIVASTDLSHYPDAETAAVVDNAILDAIASLDIKRIVEANRRLMATFRGKNLQCTACGMGGVIAMVEATKRLGAKGARRIAYDHSGTHAKKDRSRVVGYGALAVYGPFISRRVAPALPTVPAMPRPAGRMFSDVEREMLLALARKSVQFAFDGKELPTFSGLPPALQQKAAAFVSLSNKGRLRGCMGTFDRSEAVWKVVANRARAAAFRDPRDNLGNVTKDELSEIDIEISVLSTPRRLADPLSIVLGRHGIIVQSANGRRKGTYLPQVGKMFKTKEEFLSHCAKEKVGLPAGAWRDPKQAIVFAYTAEVFSESELRARAKARRKTGTVPRARTMPKTGGMPEKYLPRKAR